MNDVFTGTWYMQSIQGCFKLPGYIVWSYAYTLISMSPRGPSKAKYLECALVLPQFYFCIMRSLLDPRMTLAYPNCVPYKSGPSILLGVILYSTLLTHSLVGSSVNTIPFCD